MKKLGVLVTGACIIASVATCNKKYNNVYSKLDMIISNQEMIWLKTNELKIDSLYQEIMDLGQKLDSMVLKYDYGWEFTN